MTPAVPIPEAAAQLGLSPRQLRRAIQQGAPVVHRGRPGRSHKTLLDPAAVRRWLAAERDPDESSVGSSPAN